MVASLTLTTSNHVSMAEHWWTTSEQLQAISRCYRQVRAKTVHVSRIRSSNSARESTYNPLVRPRLR
ncbi:hypothetical protein CABS01_10182 [Colletotrichum abscissum]|uniref:uncharacterized protein n=1 Tax=Colletotrichum abscissum TaxID=1671311 RepID=UPI0027D6AF01|nr:uncharacterized protein CABS01_10182 [Colletotrichum abscissum]KAK1500458.1 hypothetical protein CABS01_10182 [Colletotrichum abscissum]